MTTKYLDGVQLVEGRLNPPTLIGSFNYSDFTVASATKWKYFAGVLSRAAKARTFIIYNSLNQQISSSPLGQVYDSIVPSTLISTPTTPIGNAAVTAGAQIIDSSEHYPGLTYHGDSIGIGLPIGATLPTSGKVDIYAVEVF